ncbi:MAG TPA: type IV pilin [Methanocorpusculum sp.]|nr:type IV pilin [Methanocorpusculum sp.]
MIQKRTEKENAVSPVVGVMLMLVVTIIIAAVVAAFAGGLAESNSAAPQAAFGGDLTYGSSLVLSHKGGDSIVGSELGIKVKIISGMYADMVKDVNISNVTLSRTSSGINTNDIIHSGDVMIIPWKDMFAESSYGGFMEPMSGDVVEVLIFDKAGNKAINKLTLTAI